MWEPELLLCRTYRCVLGVRYFGNLGETSSLRFVVNVVHGASVLLYSSFVCFPGETEKLCCCCHLPRIPPQEKDVLNDLIVIFKGHILR